MFKANTTLADGLLIALFSMIVVFIILFAISYMIDLIALVVRKSKKNQPSVGAQKKSSSKSSESESDEVVAAITAAIASYTGRDDFEVKSVQETGKSSWGISAKVNSVN